VRQMKMKQQELEQLVLPEGFDFKRQCKSFG
jgi:hypothetical protein